MCTNIPTHMDGSDVIIQGRVCSLCLPQKASKTVSSSLSHTHTPLVTEPSSSWTLDLGVE